MERLQVDYVDLWQIHALTRPEELEIALGDGGALEAFIEARDKGLVSFLGVTGHGLLIPSIHYAALERFDFDSVLLPYNYTQMQNSQYALALEKLVKVCSERNVAIQTIKSICHCPWGDTPQTRSTWYKPLEDQKDIDIAVNYVLGTPDFFLNTVGDIHLLPRVLNSASRFSEKPSDQKMQDMSTRLNMMPLFA